MTCKQSQEFQGERRGEYRRAIEMEASWHSPHSLANRVLSFQCLALGGHPDIGTHSNTVYSDTCRPHRDDVPETELAHPAIFAARCEDSSQRRLDSSEHGFDRLYVLRRRER